jgi:tetratricopeptide (TPR) repeat protein
MTAPSLTLAAAVAASLLAWPRPGRAEPDPAATVATGPERRAANALYKEGVRLYNAKQFADALDLFENAYRRYPSANIMLGIATAQRDVGRNAAAANAYQRFVDDPGADPQRVSDAQAVLHLLDATLGVIAVTFDGPPGELQLEDGPTMPVGTRRVRVDPGSFVLRGRRDGQIALVTGRVSPGAVTEVVVHWQPAPSAAAPPPAAPPKPTPVAVEPAVAAPPRPPFDVARRRQLAYAVGGGGVVLALGALGLELAANGRVADAEARCGAALRCAEPAFGQAQVLLDEAGTRRTAALVVGGVAVAALAGGAYLWWTAHEVGEVRVTPLAGDRVVGLALDGRF